MNQRVNRYISELFEYKGYLLTDNEKRQVVQDKTGFIVNKLLRKKFRRRIDDSVRKSIVKKVNLSIKENRPIHLIVPFGSYKHFWNPSHPETDWAEIFHFIWMTEYVAPILAVYEPGVVLEYVSEDIILPRMNNYPDEALEAYAKSFRKLIDFYQGYLPGNFKLKYWRIGDKYNKETLVSKVENLVPERKAAFAKLSAEDKDQEIHRSLRSMLWNGKEDLTNLTEDQKLERIIESRIVELAFYEIEGSDEFVGSYYSEDNHICVCFSFGLSHDNDEFGDLTLQSASGSSVDYWIGRGIILKNGDKLRGTIISKQQYKKLVHRLQKVEIESKLILTKNYESIEVAID